LFAAVVSEQRCRADRAPLRVGQAADDEQFEPVSGAELARMVGGQGKT